MDWHSLFVHTSNRERAAEALRAVHVEHGYAPYDPFPGGGGTPLGLSALVRLFVAPTQGRWLHLLGQPDEALLGAFSARVGAPVVYGWLGEEDGGFALYRDGQRSEDPAAFGALLTDKSSPELLRQAFEGKIPVQAVDPAAPPTAVLGAESLPPEIAQFAQQQGVDARKANRLFDRLSGKLPGRLGQSQDEAAAKALFGQGGRDAWNSLDGQRVRAIAGVLDLPDTWRIPSWQMVRDAYQVYRLKQRHPRMALLPGDHHALAAVPDAADYLPIYLGRA